MKKEIFALILLAVLAAGSAMHLIFLRRVTADVTGLLDGAYRTAEASDWESAEALAEQADEKWHSADAYMHIFIRHPETDSTADAFYDFLGSFYHRDMAELRKTYLAVKAHVANIYEMEKITPGSIF